MMRLSQVFASCVVGLRRNLAIGLLCVRRLKMSAEYMLSLAPIIMVLSHKRYRSSNPYMESCVKALFFATAAPTQYFPHVVARGDNHWPHVQFHPDGVRSS